MGLIWIIAAAGWGVAEATVFFLAPDVILTAAVPRFGLRAALRLSVIAAISAAMAGIVMYAWGAHDPAGAHRAMLQVPAIGPDLLARTAREMGGFWPLHLFTGAVTGVAYKLYAVEAGVRGIALVPFILVSFAARLARFALTTSFTALIVRILDRLHLQRWKYLVLAAGWMVFYAVYFSIRAAAQVP